jgi:uncharacterized protein (TIGR02453 family)
MWNIRFNNNKAWFTEHKSEYQSDFLLPMKELGAALYERINGQYPEHGLMLKVSRIYRDARRLRPGDGPYKENLWLSLEKPSEEGDSTVAFWFDLSPEGWSYGMGYYSARAATMAKFRERLEENPQEFEKLVAPIMEQGEFVLGGEEYARKKPAPTEGTQAWYNKKSFYFEHRQENGEELFSPDFANRLAEGYILLMPLYDYLIAID